MRIIFFLCLYFVSAHAAINPPTCGKRPFGAGRSEEDKIVGGVPAIVGDWGWQASITNNFRHFCGGVLIDNQWVLSAAHCFKSNPPLWSLEVECAVHDRTFKEEWTVTKGVSKLFVHPAFNANNFDNDIAILKLDGPVTYNNYVIPACISDGSEIFDETYKVFATGWGAVFYGGAITRYLYEGSFNLRSSASCSTTFGGLHFNGAKQICAVEDGGFQGPCQGDSGGPLSVKSKVNGNWYAIGLTSWGYGCGDGGVYTRVSYYKEWIESIIQNNP